MLGGGDSSYEAAPYNAGERKQGIGATFIAIDAAKLPDYQKRIEDLVLNFTRDRGSKIRTTNLRVTDRIVEVSKHLWFQLSKYAKNRSVPEL